jgi:hypothetical protein
MNPDPSHLSAEIIADDIGAYTDSREITVTTSNFVRAAIDHEISKYLPLLGGVNKWFHFRAPTPADNQPTIRMNRDTLYSVALVDISEGAVLSLPDVGDRYMSSMIVNQDHYINDVFHGGGEHKMDMATFDTPYVLVTIRTLVDSADPADIKAVNDIQDAMEIKAGSAKPYIVPNYDMDSFEKVLLATLELGKYNVEADRMFGPKDEVDSLQHFLGTAYGFGGLPEAEATYLSINPGLPVGGYKIDVGDVPVDAFWSVSMYNARGFFEPNDLGAYSVNNVTAETNDDSTTTVHLGDCDDGRANCLPLTDGWNYIVRLYRPRAEILEGKFEFPSPVPVE